MSTAAESAISETTGATTRSFRWRLVPAAFLAVFGFLEILFVLAVLGLLLIGKSFDFQLFEGPNSPELASRSLSGMALLAGLGVAWIVAGRLFWRKRYLLALLLAGISYPLGTIGARWMFSSQVKSSPVAPVIDPNAAPPIPRRFENQRRRAPPALAKTPTGDFRGGDRPVSTTPSRSRAWRA